MAALDRPRVEYRTPVDLVAEVTSGLVRIPPFQRGFKWEAADVVKLFDSVVRGYPIGNLLLWRRPALQQQLIVGALSISAPETDAALWVVDGQQRITSLVSALVCAHTAADARFRVHLDLETGEFHTAGARQTTPASWLPVSFLVDTATLLRWMRENAGWLTEAQMAIADQAAKAVREYQIPTYVVSSTDEDPLVDIFARMNTTGKPLTKTEVFHALHSGMAGDEPMDLRGVARTTAALGFGSLDESLALRCVLAYRGGDIFREDFHGEFSSTEDRRATFRDVVVSIRAAVAFLQNEAAVPHAKLLPYSYVMPVLVRYVRLHGEPSGRGATLLRRWVWRGAVAGTRARGISVPDIRDQVTMLEAGDPAEAAQRLLTTVRAFPEFSPELDRVNSSHAMTKLNVMGLLSAGPREFAGGGPVDIVPLLDKGTPLRTIVNDDTVPGAETIANRLIASSGSGRTLRDALVAADPVVADSHLVDAAARRLLAAGDLSGFLAQRGRAAERVIRGHIDRMAEWGARDGRAMSDILRAA